MGDENGGQPALLYTQSTALWNLRLRPTSAYTFYIETAVGDVSTLDCVVPLQLRPLRIKPAPPKHPLLASVRPPIGGTEFPMTEDSTRASKPKTLPRMAKPTEFP